MGTPSRILVVFYSRSETTAEFAGRLATEPGGDHERLREVDFLRRAGPFGFVRSIVGARCAPRRSFARWAHAAAKTHSPR